MSETYIVPLMLGKVNIDTIKFTYFNHFGEKQITSFNSYYIRDGEHNIIVDTGPGAPDSPKNSALHIGYEQKPEMRLENALPAVTGIKPEDVDIVISTHLHWDHVGENHVFQNAKFYVQRREVQYASAPPKLMKPFYDLVPGFEQLWRAQDYELIHGERSITENVSVIKIPGHTRGMQGVVVETGENVGVITMDFLPLFENYEKEIPCGVLVDIDAWYESLEKVKEIADFVLPGHDPLVFEKDRYE